MLEYEQVIDEIVKHGVVVKVNKIVDDNYIPYERKYVGCVVELDFSEHDKVFVDKIASLENQIAYMKEKKNYLRTRCMEDARDAFDSGAYGRLTIVGRRVDLEEENEKLKQKISDLESLMQKREEFLEMKNIQIAELKQRIAELERGETEKPKKINLNDRIKVKLTPLGAEIYYHQYDDIHKDYPKMKKHLQSSLPKVDENGYTEFQLWYFMELYGEHIGMCKPNVIEPLDIVIVE